MGTASLVPSDPANKGRSRGTELFLKKNFFHFIQGSLLEARMPPEKRLPPKAMRELNERLWGAFISNKINEMVRLVKAGADPHSIEQRLNKEILNCKY